MQHYRNFEYLAKFSTYENPILLSDKSRGSSSIPVVGSGLSSEHREVFCPSSARSRITYMFVWLRHGSSGHFFSTSARFFVAVAEDLSAKQRNVSLQHAARKLRVCYTHTNARQTCDDMCVPTTDLNLIKHPKCLHQLTHRIQPN